MKRALLALTALASTIVVGAAAPAYASVDNCSVTNSSYNCQGGSGSGGGGGGGGGGGHSSFSPGTDTLTFNGGGGEGTGGQGGGGGFHCVVTFYPFAYDCNGRP